MPPKIRPTPPATLATGGGHHRAENQAPSGAGNLNIPPFAAPAGGPAVTLRVARPAPTKARHPWMEALLPYLGKLPATQSVRFVNGVPSVDVQPGAGPDLGLRDKKVFESLCDAVVERLCSQAPCELPAFSLFEYRLAAIRYAYQAVQHFAEHNGDHMTMGNFLSFAKPVMNSEGNSIEDLDRLTLAMPCKSANHPIASLKELACRKFRDRAAVGLFEFTMLAIAREWVRLSPDDPLPRALDRAEFESVLDQLATGERAAEADAVRMLTTLEGNAAFSETLLEFLLRLQEAMSETPHKEKLDIATGTLMLRLCPDVLAKVIFDPEEVASLAHQAFMAVGFQGAIAATEIQKDSPSMGPLNPEGIRIAAQGIGPSRVLTGLSAMSMDKSPTALALATLLTAQIPMLLRNSRLAKVEEMLRLALPDEDIDFDGEPIDDLLECFLSPEQRLLPLPESSGALTGVQDSSPAEATTESDPEEDYSMDVLKARLRQYERQKAQRQAAAASAAAAVPTEPESNPTARPDKPGHSDGKQPGSKSSQRITNYKHHLPGRRLAQRVRKVWTSDLKNRKGTAFSANTKVHGQTKHAPRQEPGEGKR